MDCEQIESVNIAELYLMDKLESFKRVEFEIHFLSCQRCADLLFEIQDFREALLAAEPRSEPRYSKSAVTRPATSWHNAALVAAAVVVVALFVSVLLLRENFRLRQQLSQAAVVTPAPPNPVPETEQNANLSARQDQGPGHELSPSRRGDQFSSPQINTPIIVLNAIRGTPASNPETNEIAIGPSQWFVISVELETRRFDEYRATILTHDRRAVWKSGVLRPDRHDAITIGCAPDFFRAGDYLLILEGQPKKETFSPVGTYPFRVVRKKK
jgi:hypothetical protein